jgi:hypothetical protein
MVNRNRYPAKLDLKRQNRLLAGLVSERFPEVSGIVITMTYYQKGANPVLMERTINVFPTSDAYFKMDCMIRGCDGGGFDLTPAITELAKNRKNVKKGSLVCNGQIDTLSPDHAHIDYEIVMQYNKLPRNSNR